MQANVPSRRAFRVILVAVLAIVHLAPLTWAGGTVKLAWNLSWEPDIAGYRVHYGLESGNYTETVDVGYKVKAELTDLPVGTSYFCAVTAYNTYGLESEYSNEISFTVRPPPEERDTDADGLSDFFEATYGVNGDLDPLSDLDGDGLSALSEFFHGLNPNQLLATALPAVETIEVDDELYLCVRYLVDPTATNFVAMSIERATALTPIANWEAGHTAVVSSGPSAENPDLLEVIERSLSPISNQSMEFLRFRHEALSQSQPDSEAE